MTAGSKVLSAALTTVQLLPTQDGTHFTYTEQGAYFDGNHSPEAAEQGYTVLLDKLAEVLRNTD